MNKKTVKIIFVRHGESEKNVLDLHSHTLDKHPLTDKGRKEVESIASKIKDEVDIVIVSPILRARETAEIINKKIRKEIIYDDAISEYEYGEWNDVPREELLIRYKSYINYKKLASKEEKFNFKLGKTGESRNEIVKRVEKFIKKLIKNNIGKTVMLVSHGGINAAIHRVLTDCSFDEYFTQEEVNHSVIQYFIVDKKLKLISHKSKNIK